MKESLKAGIKGRKSKLTDEIQRRISYIVEHSQFSISEKEYQEIEENEHTLVRIEKL